MEIGRPWSDRLKRLNCFGNSGLSTFRWWCYCSQVYKSFIKVTWWLKRGDSKSSGSYQLHQDKCSASEVFKCNSVHCILIIFWRASVQSKTYLVIGAFEVDKHLANEDAPAAPCMAVLDLGEPALQGRLVVLFTEQQLGGISSEYILRKWLTKTQISEAFIWSHM